MEQVSRSRRRPNAFARLLARSPALLYRLGLGGLLPWMLLLVTTGRRSGRPRVTPLAYQAEGDTFYVVSVRRATHADWYRNLVAHPEVTLQVGRRRLPAIATALTEPQEKAHVLRLFSQGSAWAGGRFLGIPREASDTDLLALAPQRTIVALRRRSI